MEETKVKNNKKIIIPIIIFIVIIIITMIISSIFALININNTNMIKGVTIEGVDISNLNIEEATKKIKDRVYNISNSDIKLKHEEDENIVKINEIKIEFDIEKAIIDAYNVGRNKNIIQNNYEILKSNILGKKIKLNYRIDEEETNKILDNIERNLEGVLIENAYYIEKEELIITKGKEGIKIVKESTISNIKENIDNKLNNIENDSVKIIIEKVKPKEIDIDEIHKEIYKESKDAYYTESPFKLYPEINGVDFNIEEAKNILKEDKNEYRIPLEITIPKITTSQISTSVFPNTLGKFTTKYDASAKNRSTNISLVANAINEKVVLPGETFSFNETVGNTTKEKGYQLATSYINGKLVQDYGGGTCQVSTTLYNAVLKANLDIVSRKNHSYIVSYVDIGTDATIAYPTTDFKFKNNRNYAIKILANAKNGILKIDILGIKEPIEYEVLIESKIIQVIPYTTKTIENNQLPEGTQNVIVNGVNGYKSITYKILKLNGIETSRTVLSEDTYKSMTREIEIGTKNETTN